MTDRIRLLWAQCVIKHTKSPMNWQDAADEFAKLLIEQCCEIADQVEKADMDSYVSKYIKAYFEIEQ